MQNQIHFAFAECQSLFWVLEVQREITQEADSMVVEIDTHNPNYNCGERQCVMQIA